MVQTDIKSPIERIKLSNDALRKAFHSIPSHMKAYEIIDDYIVGKADYYTLGKKCPHTKLVEILQRKAPREKLLLAYRYEDADGS